MILGESGGIREEETERWKPISSQLFVHACTPGSADKLYQRLKLFLSWSSTSTDSNNGHMMYR